jgi:hypothetical protein
MEAAVEEQGRAGRKPAVNGEGQGIVWVLGSLSVSDKGTD